MTATCSCPPGACHGGHTIDIGPSWAGVTDDRLRELRDDPFAAQSETVTVDPETRSMAAELLALRARVAALEADADGQARAIEEVIRERDAAERVDLDGRDLRARIAELEAEAQADERAINEARDERDEARATLDAIRHALAQHPRCDIHPDDEPVSCGWMRAVGSVQWALDQAPTGRRRATVEQVEALHRRTSELEDRTAALAAQREPLGYGVVVEAADGVGGLWVQTSPLLTEADARDRARFYGHQGARAVAMIEVGE